MFFSIKCVASSIFSWTALFILGPLPHPVHLDSFVACHWLGVILVLLVSLLNRYSEVSSNCFNTFCCSLTTFFRHTIFFPYLKSIIQSLSASALSRIQTAMQSRIIWSFNSLYWQFSERHDAKLFKSTMLFRPFIQTVKAKQNWGLKRCVMHCHLLTPCCMHEVKITIYIVIPIACVSFQSQSYNKAKDKC